MRKIVSIILFNAFAFAISSCVSEEDDLFSKSAAERLNEASELYTQSLLTSKHGWALEYYPQATTAEENEPVYGAGYLMVTKFESDRSVVIGMNNFLSYNKYDEDKSAWEVITDNGPVLSFNTYNRCLHAFSNPEDVPGTADNEKGKGMLGDYEFVMVDVPESGEYIMLKGKKRGSYSRLTKLDEETDFAEYLADVKTFQTTYFPKTAPNYDVITIGEDRYKMIMDQQGGNYGVVKMWPFDSDSIFTKELNPFLITRHGVKDSYTYNLRFHNALKGSGDTTEQEFVYNAEDKKFHGVNDEANTIEGANPTEHFYMALEAGHKWNLDIKSVSETFNNALNVIINDAAALNYTFKGMVFKSFSDGNVNLEMTFTTVRKVNGRNQTVTATANYNYKLTCENGEALLAYDSPVDDAAETVANAIASLQGFLKDFGGRYVMTASDNPFVITQVRGSKSDKPDYWFDLNYAK